MTPGELEGVAVPVEVVVWVGAGPLEPPDGAVPVGATVMLFVIETVQVTKLPPPFSEPLHWLTVTGKVELLVPEALHVIAPPPPVPEPLHCVTVGEP